MKLTSAVKTTVPVPSCPSKLKASQGRAYRTHRRSHPSLSRAPPSPSRLRQLSRLPTRHRQDTTGSATMIKCRESFLCAMLERDASVREENCGPRHAATELCAGVVLSDFCPGRCPECGFLHAKKKNKIKTNCCESMTF